MEDQKQVLETFFNRTEELAATSIELIKLKTIDTSIQVGSGLLSGLIVGFLSAVCLLFLSIGGAFWIGEALKETYYGFLIIAGFYCFLAFVGYVFLPRTLERLLGKLIIQKAIRS